ncbi:PAS domain-containing protein [Malaciobacter sp. WC5094]
MAAGQETVLDDYAFLVSETDEKGIIRFANNDFCSIAEYTIEELLGQPHSMVRHPDMPSKAFKSLWETVQKGEIWTGYVKNATKNGGYYWVYATVYPFESCDGSKGYMSCRRKASSSEIAEAQKLYDQWNKEEGRN